MKDKDFVLRDFIYLDWERVRSFSAQLLKGIPQDATLDAGHELGAEGQVEAKLPWILKGHAGGDYRYFRSQSETRSLHHHVYTLFEEQLEENNLLITIDDTFEFSQWTEDFFYDGQFVRVTGMVRLMDYAWISMMLEALPKMMSAAGHAKNLALKQQQKSGLITDEQYRRGSQEVQKIGKEIKDLAIHKMTELIKQLYGDVVRLKILPSKEHPKNVFVASGDPASFHDTTAALSQKYGYEIDARWVALGQINKSRIADEPLLIPIGNEMEDSFEQVAFGINNLIRIASAAKFPAVSFTPISIYRTC